MKLSVTDYRSLISILDSIPQKNLPTTADVRKCVGAVNQIRKACDGPLKEYEEVNQRVAEFMKPYQDKIAKHDPKKDEEKIQAIVADANKKAEPLNKELQALDEKYGLELVEIDLDPNYKAFVKANWEDKVRPSYRSTEVMLRVAEAFDL